MVTRNVERRASGENGFSLIEMVVVLAIIGVLAGVGAVGYTQFINQQRLNTTADIIASNLRQARQLAIATRQSYRVKFSVPDQDPSRDPLPQEVWIEALQKRGSGTSKSAQNWIEVSDPKRLPDGVTVESFNGDQPGGTGTSDIYCAEFNFRGQMTKSYFVLPQGEGDLNSLSLYIHVGRVGEPTDPNVEEQRPRTHSVEVLRLTGRVRTYDYGYGEPFPTTEHRG